MTSDLFVTLLHIVKQTVLWATLKLCVLKPDQFVQVPGQQQYVAQKTGVTQNSGGSAVRWEQGTCNASFRDEAQKLRKPESNGKAAKKVESCTKTYFRICISPSKLNLLDRLKHVFLSLI